MPVATSINTERRQQSCELIAKLQNERRELWSLYSNVTELKPFSANDAVKSLLTEFSQILVDYVSFGHFGFYERLLSGTERRGGVMSVAQELYPEFSATTDAVISFNDKYENVEKIEIFEDLEQDLSVLGENLAKRIDLEDWLCEVIQ
jgi:regulator of sigma D